MITWVTTMNGTKLPQVEESKRENDEKQNGQSDERRHVVFDAEVQYLITANRNWKAMTQHDSVFDKAKLRTQLRARCEPVKWPTVTLSFKATDLQFSK